MSKKRGGRQWVLCAASDSDEDSAPTPRQPKGPKLLLESTEMQKLKKELKSVEHGSGNFFTSGEFAHSVHPGLYVDDVGYISLPLTSDQAIKLKSVCTQAPFGLGTQTVIDTAVRNTYQLDPSKYKLKNEQFEVEFNHVVQSIKSKLGFARQKVKAIPYKLLLYEKGGHFKAHRDTEKENGMFASLIVQLPCEFSGGQLVIRHRDREEVIDCSIDNDRFRPEYTTFYTAFFADCEHELREVSSGYRLALVYSLCWKSAGKIPSAVQSSVTSTRLSNVLQEYRQTGEFFSWVLEHMYTEEALSNHGVNSLKGNDKSIGDTLKAANDSLVPSSQFELFLVQVSKEISEDGEWWGRFESCGDTPEITIELNNWFTFKGCKHRYMNDFAKLTSEYNYDEFVVNWKGDAAKFWGKCTDKDESGPTGNEGATETRFYKRCLIVAIPIKLMIEVATKYAGKAACSFITSWDPSYKEKLEKYQNERKKTEPAADSPEKSKK